MELKKVSIESKAKLFEQTWSPRIIGELNGQHVKLAHFQGEFGWHFHEFEDEMFFVVSGEIEIELENNSAVIKENEFLIVPKGVRHNPRAKKRATVMLFEPISTLNTGNVINDKTVGSPEII